MSKESTMQVQAIGSSNSDEESAKKTILMKKLNCGSCEGLVRHAVLDTRCQEVGKLAISKACGSHKPDVFALATGEEKVDLLAPIAEAMVNLSTNDLQILASLMLGEKNTRRHGYKFHQKVYVRIRGETTANYMSNFAVGYVLSADKDSVRVIGESGTTSMTFLNDRDSLTLYTIPQFNALRKVMIAAKAFRDPCLQTRVIPMAPRDDVVRTFDEAVNDGIVPKKKRSERGDLVSLISRLSRGHLRTAKTDRRENDDRRSKESSGTSVRFKY